MRDGRSSPLDEETSHPALYPSPVVRFLLRIVFGFPGLIFPWHTPQEACGIHPSAAPSSAAQPPGGVLRIRTSIVVKVVQTNNLEFVLGDI